MEDIAAVAHRYLGGKPQVAGNELIGGLMVAVLALTFGECVFLIPLENRETANAR